MQELVSVQQAGDYLGVSRQMVARYIKDNLLPAVKAGRSYVIRREALIVFGQGRKRHKEKRLKKRKAA